jgi:hypothetical protein
VAWPEAVLQVYVLAPEAVKLSEAPKHTVDVPLTLTIGSGTTLSVCVAWFVQPKESVPNTVYEVVTDGKTEIVFVVDEVLHK